jgi:hypothetical protein
VIANPPVASSVLSGTPVPQSAVSQYVQPVLVQSSNDVVPVHTPDNQIPATYLPEVQYSAETIALQSDENVALQDIATQDILPSSLVQENEESIPTSRLIKRIGASDGRIYSIIKDLESGRYTLLDEKNGKRDTHTFQFKQDAIAYVNVSV